MPISGGNLLILARFFWLNTDDEKNLCV